MRADGVSVLQRIIVSFPGFPGFHTSKLRGLITVQFPPFIVRNFGSGDHCSPEFRDAYHPPVKQSRYRLVASIIINRAADTIRQCVSSSSVHFSPIEGTKSTIMSYQDIDALKVEYQQLAEKVWAAVAHVRGEIRGEVQRQVTPLSRAIATLEAEVLSQQEHLFQSTVSQGKTIGFFPDNYAGVTSSSNGSSSGTSNSDFRVLNALIHKMEKVDHESKRYGKVLTKLREGVKVFGADVAIALKGKADLDEVMRCLQAHQDKAESTEEEMRLAMGDLSSGYRKDMMAMRKENTTAAHQVSSLQPIITVFICKICACICTHIARLTMNVLRFLHIPNPSRLPRCTRMLSSCRTATTSWQGGLRGLSRSWTS